MNALQSLQAALTEQPFPKVVVRSRDLREVLARLAMLEAQKLSVHEEMRMLALSDPPGTPGRPMSELREEMRSAARGEPSLRHPGEKDQA